MARHFSDAELRGAIRAFDSSGDPTTAIRSVLKCDPETARRYCAMLTLIERYDVSGEVGDDRWAMLMQDDAFTPLLEVRSARAMLGRLARVREAVRREEQTLSAPVSGESPPRGQLSRVRPTPDKQVVRTRASGADGRPVVPALLGVPRSLPRAASPPSAQLVHLRHVAQAAPLLARTLPPVPYPHEVIGPGGMPSGRPTKAARLTAASRRNGAQIESPSLTPNPGGLSEKAVARRVPASLSDLADQNPTFERLCAHARGLPPAVATDAYLAGWHRYVKSAEHLAGLVEADIAREAERHGTVWPPPTAQDFISQAVFLLCAPALHQAGMRQTFPDSAAVEWEFAHAAGPAGGYVAAKPFENGFGLGLPWLFWRSYPGGDEQWQAHARAIQEAIFHNWDGFPQVVAIASECARLGDLRRQLDTQWHALQPQELATGSCRWCPGAMSGGTPAAADEPSRAPGG